MAQTVCVVLSSLDRQLLEAIVADRNRPQKHVERARVVLAAAECGPVQLVAARLGVSRPMVWRWQLRFTEEGADGLLRDKTRKPGKQPIAAETVARVVALTCAEPPHQATHWTGLAMAHAAGFTDVGAAHLAGAQATAAPRADLQALARPGLCRQADRYRRPLHGPAGAGGRAVD